MPRRTYTIVPQRLRVGEGYVPCEPHQACRVSIIETTFIPAKLGRRAYQTKRTVRTFSGSAMMLNAQMACDGLTGKTRPKPVRGSIWGRSCTIKEYDSIMSRKRPTGSY